MDSLKLIFLLLVVTLATKNAFGKKDNPRERDVANEIQSSATFNILESKKSVSNIISQLLQRSNEGTCGVPHPRCTSECFSETECVCHQRIRGFSYYIIPCRVHSKICRVGEHETFDYTNINPLHSAALPANPSCKKIRQGVTEEEKQQILETHNNFRAKIARGEESRSPQQGVSQPSGSNIKELIWNDELAFIAQEWADECNFAHETEYSRREPCSRPYEYTGQNLYKGMRTWTYTASQWPGAIKGWYDEVQHSPVSIVSKYAWGVTSKMIGHYTQLVWAETYEIGCGAVYYEGVSYKGGVYPNGSTTLYVCNYGPAGNMIGEEMYKIGNPATKCGDTGISTKYPGLCATEI